MSKSTQEKLLLVPVPDQESWVLKDFSHFDFTDSLKIVEFEKFEYALSYLSELKDWPSCNPVIAGSIFLVAEFIKYANNQKY